MRCCPVVTSGEPVCSCPVTHLWSSMERANLAGSSALEGWKRKEKEKHRMMRTCHRRSTRRLSQAH
eukprot:scaffold789_cov261-Pinguiococcus_pyrenoidosus.AAC.11